MFTNPNSFTTSAWDGWWNWCINTVLSGLTSDFEYDARSTPANNEKIFSASLAGVDRFTLEQNDWQDPSGHYGDDGAVEIGGESYGLLNYED